MTTKVRRQASEDVARMFARAASACQRCYCGCALPFCCVSLLHFLNPTPMGRKRKKKHKSTHQWPSVTEHHLVHTIGAKDESIQTKKKNEPYVWHTQERPPERSEAHGYEPKWHFARHPARVVFFSGKRRRQLGGKKCRLSVTHVWLFC